MTLTEAQSFADRINRGETPTTLIKHQSERLTRRSGGRFDPDKRVTP